MTARRSLRAIDRFRAARPWPGCRTPLAWVFAAAALAVACGSPPPSIEEYRTRVEAIGEPDFDPARKKEPGYMEAYRAEQHRLYQQKADLLLAAARAHRDDERVPELILERWKLLGWNQDPGDVAAEVLADLEALLPEFEGPEVSQRAAYLEAFYRGHAGYDFAQRRDLALDYSRRYPDDEEATRLLTLAAEDPRASTRDRRALWGRIAEAHPDTHWGPFAAGRVRRLESIGRPFEFSFQDVASGETVSHDTLAGRVVVVDFWSTSCLPCIEEMPRLKRLYEEFRQRGVEFIGVSLDEPVEAGGRDAVQRFIEEFEVPWPIWYQGNGYDSEFSRSWGVGGIPEMFVVDPEGRLVDTEARDRLEEILAELV